MIIEKAMCKNCQWYVKRPDMKNIKYCVKRDFPILNITADGCTKYIRRKSE